MNLIVEALDETHKRMPAFATDRVTSLADIDSDRWILLIMSRDVKLLLI